jgi:gluconolactonase
LKMSVILLGTTVISFVGVLMAAGGGRGSGGAGATTGPAFDRSRSPVAEGEKPVKLSEGTEDLKLAFTEGATSDKDGNIFFIDQPNDRILEWEFDRNSPDPLKGRLLTFLHPSGYSNGMSFDNEGNLISCADEKNELWRVAAPFPPRPADPKQGFKPADLKITVLIKDREGKPLNGPNDVWVVPTGPQAGGMYITDPLYARTWWTNRPGGRGMQQPGKYVYFLSPDAKTLTPVVTDFRTPNGIIGTPDGKTLYVSDIDARQTFSYTIKDDGTLADKKLFCNAGSDGMTIDSDGNIYTTSGNARTGVGIWDKTGKQVDQIAIGSANCCFGGKNGDILFICSSHDVWGVKMRTHRVGPQ